MGWRDYPGLFGWAHYNCNDPYKWDAGGVRARGEGNMMTEAEIGVRHFENGGGHKPRNQGGHWKLKKSRKWVLPSEPPEGIHPLDTLT